MPNKYLDDTRTGELIHKIYLADMAVKSECKNYTDATETTCKSYTDTAVAGLVDSAPGTLDTLNELAAALGNDPNFATTIATLIDTKCAAAKAEAILAAHPVGSYYWSDDPTSPATLFGGTWEALPAGYTLIAQGSGSDTFGNFTYTAGQTYGERMHTLTVGEMPVHKHGGEDGQAFIINHNANDGTLKAFSFSAGEFSRQYRQYTGIVGGDAAHNNLPPVKATYAWLRTA